jgi:TolB protein
VIAAASPAAPAPIYFVRFADGGAHPRLAVLEAGRVRIVRVPVSAVAAPAVANDGRVAFVGGTNLSRRPDFSGPSHIWIARSDGKQSRPLTSGSVLDGAPAWSPDGRSIVFVRSAANGRSSSLWTVDIATRRTRRLTRGSLDGEPSWSRSGRIAFVRIDPATYQSGIWTIDPRSPRLLRRIPVARRGLTEPVWSPDGHTLSVEDGRALYTVRADGSHLRLVVRLPTDAQGAIEDPHPSFAPDGRRLVFCAWRRAANRSDLFVVAVGGGAGARVTSSPGLDTQPAWGP